MAEAVTVTLKSFNHHQEFGKVLTADGDSVTIQASRLRKAGLARRNENRIHNLDRRIVPGVQLVVDIGRNEKDRLSVTRVYGLANDVASTSPCGSALAINDRGVGTIDWVNDSYGFVTVLGVFAGDTLSRLEAGSFYTVFVHISCVHPKLLSKIKEPGVEYEFMIIPGRDKRTRAKITNFYS